MNTPQVDGGSHCGKYVTVKNTANGKTVTAKVADRASTFPSAPSPTLLTLTLLSQSALAAVTDLSTSLLELMTRYAILPLPPFAPSLTSRPQIGSRDSGVLPITWSWA